MKLNKIQYFSVLPDTQEYRFVMTPDDPALEKRSLKPAESSTMICLTDIIGDTHVSFSLKIDKIHHGSGDSFKFTNSHFAAAGWYLLNLYRSDKWRKNMYLSWN